MQLSIITINYNNAEGLKKTLDSVAAQTQHDFEHIVIDGDSTDASKEVIKSFNYPNLSWVSEPDNGIYHAMNKGIIRAKGEYLLFLNSGDYLEKSNVLQSVIPYLSKGVAIISGDLIFDEKKGRRLRRNPEKITFSYLVGNAISHPSTFIKRELFLKYGCYDENLKIVSDWAFFIKVLGFNNENYMRMPVTVSVFDTNGISTKEDNLKNVYKEREQVLRTYFPRIFNNENDIYVFNKFKTQNKRFKYLKTIDQSPIVRKITTLVLAILALIAKLFKK